MVEAMRRHLGLGLVAMLASSAAFGTSGPFAKSLMVAGWSPGCGRPARITGAALAPAAVRPVEPARAVGSHAPRAAPGGALRHAGRRRGPARLLPGRRAHGRRHRAAHRVPRHRAGRALGVGADPAAAAPAHRRRHRAGPGRARPVLDVTGQTTPPLSGCCGGCSPPPASRATTCWPAVPPPSPRPPSRGSASPSAPCALAALGLVGVLPMDVGAPPWRSPAPASRRGWPWPSWSSWPPRSPTCSASWGPACSARPSRRSSASPRCSSPCSSPGCCSPSCRGGAAARRRGSCCSPVSWPCASASVTPARATGARDAVEDTDYDVRSTVA